MNDQQVKECSKCNTPKPLDNFSKNARASFGRDAWCKKCHSDYTKATPEYQASLVRARNNRAHTKAPRVRGKNKPASIMYWKALDRAKQRGLPFTISKSDVVIPSHCPVLGIPLQPGTGVLTDNSPSLDRIIPELGYVPGNVIVVSHKANRIKTDASPVELQKVADFYNKLTIA